MNDWSDEVHALFCKHMAAFEQDIKQLASLNGIDPSTVKTSDPASMIAFKRRLNKLKADGLLK